MKLKTESDFLELKKSCAKRSKSKSHDYQIQKFQSTLLSKNFRREEVMELTCKYYGITKPYCLNLFNSLPEELTNRRNVS